jgi:hypothetical protein
MIAASVFFAAPASAQVVDEVTICHARSAENNPYGPQAITVSVSSIITGPNGHDTHDGPLFPEDGWGDIIPPFVHEGGAYPGKNWPEGQAILENDCQIPGQGDDDDGPGDGDGDDGDGDDGDDGDGDDGDDADGDDGSGDDDEVLPRTGSPSYWILFTGGLLTVLGIAILSNGSLGREQVVGRHVKL